MHDCARPEMKGICTERRFIDAGGLDAATEDVLLGRTVVWTQEAGD